MELRRPHAETRSTRRSKDDEKYEFVQSFSTAHPWALASCGLPPDSCWVGPALSGSKGRSIEAFLNHLEPFDKAQGERKLQKSDLGDFHIRAETSELDFFSDF